MNYTLIRDLQKISLNERHIQGLNGGPIARVEDTTNGRVAYDLKK